MRKYLGFLFIIIGLSIGTYYFIEWNTGRSAAEELNPKELKKYEKMEANAKERPEPNTQQEKETATKEPVLQTPSTNVNHTEGDKIAYLVVPKFKQKYSVFWGADENVLKKGVGMFVSELTTAPDGGGHTVLSGHRDTIFYKLDELETGDMLNVEYDKKVYSYSINKIFITDPDDRTVIVKKGVPKLTLTTCYPFNFVGDAPERYIIQAELIDSGT
ncbi:class D sortase [Bacillus sp. BA3]|uniref:class D sortase n=1 Tax=Bacillus sp. BA3 TaxID=2057910 RepID=UPI000C33BC8E|nr:class D sortase [Bacillus sp. BA3]PKF89678.1 class D sortase [Bacillus sp. BA3]